MKKQTNTKYKQDNIQHFTNYDNEVVIIEIKVIITIITKSGNSLDARKQIIYIYRDTSNDNTEVLTYG
jgi:hypothetical protein